MAATYGHNENRDNEPNRANNNNGNNNNGNNDNEGVWQRTAKNRTVRLVILITGAIYIGAMVYGSGMKRQVKTLQSVNEQRKNAQRDYRLAQMDLRLRLAAMEQLEARRQLGFAISDAQNGGSGSPYIGDAVRLLTDAQNANTSNADLSESLSDINTYLLGESVTYRSPQVWAASAAEIAKKMDAALDKQIPNVIKSSRDSDTAHPVIAPTMNDVPQLPGNDVTNTGVASDPK